MLRILSGTVIMLLLVVSACKKKSQPPPPAPALTVASDYQPLSEGSYWIYDLYQVDSLGNSTPMGNQDSIRIMGDTMINGNTYTIIGGTNEPAYAAFEQRAFVRDSAEFMVTSEGDIYLAIEPGDDTLRSVVSTNSGGDTVFVIHYVLSDGGTITVPAGMFEGINYQGLVHLYPPFNYWPNPRYMDNVFAQGIGKVLETTFYASSANTIEKRLIRYHIEP